MKKKILFLCLFSLFLFSTYWIGDAFAIDEPYDEGTSMLALICGVLGFLTGGVGKALAAFACIGISLAFLGGKVSWTLILTFSLGMACIFGAPSIINIFSGGGNDKPCERAANPTA